jgi:hypothetical protein
MMWHAIAGRTCRGSASSGERDALLVGGALRQRGELQLERCLLVRCGGLQGGGQRGRLVTGTLLAVETA